MEKNASRGLGSRLLSCLSAPGGCPDTLFPGTGDAGLFVSRDGGRSWSRAGRQTLGDRIMAVRATRDGRTVYAGTQETDLFVSRDGGATWNAIVLPFESQPIVTSMDIDPADELHLAVTVTGGGTGLSRDGGRTWVASSKGSPPSDCATVQFLPDGAPGLVLGTQSGALYFSADGLDWQLTSQLPEGGARLRIDALGYGNAGRDVPWGLLFWWRYGMERIQHRDHRPDPCRIGRVAGRC